MRNTILGFGALACIVVGVPTFISFMILGDRPPPSYAMAVGYLIMLIAFSTIFVAVKRYRDRELGGVIRFWPALQIGLGITLIGTLFYVLTWEAVLLVKGPGYIDMQVGFEVARKRAAGESEAKIAEMLAYLPAYRDNIFFRMPITALEILPVGLAVSLVSALLLRSPRFLPARATVPAPAP